MSNIRSLTTGQAARYCHVSQATIINWIKEEKLEAYTTPGGHHRILLSDFLSFLKAYKMPIDPTLKTSSRPRVLIVSDGPQAAELTQVLQEHGGFEVALAGNTCEAGAQVARLKPDAVVLDVTSPTLDWPALCRWLHDSPNEKPIPVLAVGSPEDVKAARASNDDARLPGATPPDRLEAELEALLESTVTGR
jgi:excisionase family DNA binding protein